MPIDFNQQVIEEFRANGGRVGGPFEGGRLLLLTTVGAKTGASHTTPLAYLPDGERVLVIASAGGAPKHPDWFHNLVANPRVTVENGVFTYEAQAVVLTGAERDRLFARAAEANPGWADYQGRATRTLPVIALYQVPSGPPTFNAPSFGAALKQLHDAFRRELGLVRREIAESGAMLGAQLRVNCLTVCQGLHYHHTSEDTGMFPALAQQHPELGPVIDRLRDEHEQIATLLDDLQAVVSAQDADPRRLLADVDRLTTELEAHLTLEEEQLVPALDAAAPAAPGTPG